MWNKIFSALQKKDKRHDEVFGLLERPVTRDIYGKKTQADFLQGSVVLDTMLLKVNLMGDDEDVLVSQRNFVRQLHGEFPALVTTELVPALERDLGSWLDVPAIAIDYDQAVILRSMTLPDCRSLPVHWQLVLFFVPADLTVTVAWIDHRVTHVRIA